MTRGPRRGHTEARSRIAAPAYLSALRMLARRELSEAQVRQRLARKGYDDEAIGAAIDRLLCERAIDDVRVAEAIAHTEVTLRRRGSLRVTRRIEQAGITSEIARRAVASVYAEVDADALLEATLARRLGGRTRVTDQRELQRLHRYLLRQGFEADRVLAALAHLRRR
jgi:regulatory protein